MSITQNNKHKALKNTKNTSHFFKAFVLAAIICIFGRFILSIGACAVLYKLPNSSRFTLFACFAVTVISLLCAGVTAAVTDRKNCIMISLLLGAFCLAVSYLLAVLFDIYGNYGYLQRAIVCAVNLFTPLAGARLALSGKKRRKREL